MNKQELIELLKKSDDKLSIFGNEEILNECRITSKEYYELIREFLTDEEKVRLLKLPCCLNMESWKKSNIISLINDEALILKVINDDTIMKDFRTYEFLDIFIKKVNDSGIIELLHDSEFVKKHNIDFFDIPTIIKSLSEESREKVLLDKKLLKEDFKMDDFMIIPLITELVSSEEIKDKFIEDFKLKVTDETEVLKSCSDDHKIEKLLKKDYFNGHNITELLSTVSCEKLVRFIKEHKDIIQEKEVKLFELVSKLDVEQQKLFVENLEDMNLTLIEKKEILAMLKDEAKEEIDTTDFPDEYKVALSMKKKNRSIVLDLDRNLEDYRGLDRLITECPENYPEEKIAKLMELCDICPDMTILSSLNEFVTYSSTAKEYKEAEQWIASLLESINPEYSQLQKLAIIDHAIGKKISYSPDFDTEVFDSCGARAIWKIISSGYGVCNGISRAEQYILSRVGVKSELVGSGNHAFLKIIDIELPLENGEIVRGNTILDSTWNLSANRFDGKPNNFCLSYEDIRKRDIDSEGKDHECHKNDKELSDAILSLDEKNLRELFKSVGLTNSDGILPVKKIIDESSQIDETYKDNFEENLRNQFLLLKKACPEFAECQNSSMNFLKTLLSNMENLKFNKGVVDRVYSRDDEDRKAVMYVFFDFGELGKNFFFADKSSGEMIELPQEEFVKRFECYDLDLKKENGIRPWESKEQIKEDDDLSKISGKVVAEEGDAR